MEAESVVTNVKPGFSDSLLLSISVAGFCVLAVAMYRIVQMRVKTFEDPHDRTDFSPEEFLVQANVATLNRAQRRARAKLIGKEQRKATIVLTRNNNDAESEQGTHLMALENEEQHHTQQQHRSILTRRERQAFAKIAEKEERRLYQQERQKQQQKQTLAANQEQKHTQRYFEIERSQDEQKQAAAREQQQRADARDAWETFLSTETKTQSVQEFLDSSARLVRLDNVGASFNVSVAVVENRIRQLMVEGRLAGFFSKSDESFFVVISDDELLSIASTIQESGTATLYSIAKICQETLHNKKSEK